MEIQVNNRSKLSTLAASLVAGIILLGTAAVAQAAPCKSNCHAPTTKGLTAGPKFPKTSCFKSAVVGKDGKTVTMVDRCFSY
jgi:hypothetical protein